VGTIAPQTNRYTLFYFDSPYPNSQPPGAPPGRESDQVVTHVGTADQAALAAAEVRVDDTYDLIVATLLPPIGDIACPAGQFAYCLGVQMIQAEDGPYCTWSGQRWIGARINIMLEQEFG
jgi:hypothetical protein